MILGKRGGTFDPSRQHDPGLGDHIAVIKAAANRNDCLHIIEATGDSVLQENCGCPGNKMTSVWECELFGRVAPFAKGDPVDGVRACQKCGRYEKALQADSTAE